MIIRANQRSKLVPRVLKFLSQLRVGYDGDPYRFLVFEKSKHIVDDQENDRKGEHGIPPGEPNQNFPTVLAPHLENFPTRV